MKVLILLLLFFLSLLTTAQVKENKFDFEKVQTKVLSLPVNTSKKIIPAFAIKEIQVIDARFNQDILGYVKNGESGGYLKLKLANNEDIRSLLISCLATSNSDTARMVLCVIKKIILSDNINIPEDKTKANNVKDNSIIKSGIVMTLEFFIKQDQMLLPLYRFDSTIVGKDKIRWNASDYIANTLTASLMPFETLAWSTVPGKYKKIRLSRVDSSIVERINLPIFSGTPTKGVYATFDEFKNNNPSILDFTIEKTEKADFIYTKDGKNPDKLRTDIWGYCDGKDIYLYSAENFFKIYLTDKTVAVYGAKGYSSERALRLNFGLFDAIAPNSAYAKSKTKNKFVLNLSLLMLDIDSGELY